MTTWLTRLARKTRTKKTQTARRLPLRLEELEAREVPAITIQINYSFDTSGFFANNPAAKATLQAAANDLASQINNSLPAITPGGGNTWAETFYNPATGNLQTVTNPSVGTNTIVVYAGARVLSGNEISVGGNGGYSASGSTAWVDFIPNRGDTTGFSTWGGSVAFNPNINWFFGTSANGIGSNQYSFFSSATHELSHVLGFGTAPQWFAQVSNDEFTGAHAEAIYGGPVPLTWGNAEVNDVNVNGVRPVDDLDLEAGVQTAPATPLDWALADIGWSVNEFAPASPPPVSPPPPPPPVTLAPVTNNAANGPDLVVVSGGGGWFQVFEQMSDGQLHAIAGPIHPFAGYTGEIRSAVGDFNGDGTEDVAVATAAGPSAEIAIYNGANYSLLLGPTEVLGGFTGGAFLAAGDIMDDGRDQLAVSADQGGSPRIQIYYVNGGQVYLMDDFFAFNSPTFRGGARIALGDINRDGYADLVVTAGPGGGPRVSVYSGRGLAVGQQNNLIPDFFAYDPNLRTGAFVAVGDINGDGYGDIIFSADIGGSSRTIGYSGALLTANPGVNPMDLPFLFSQFATPENLPAGLRVTVKDLAGNGQEELLFTTAEQTDSSIRIVTAAQILSPEQPPNKVEYPIGAALSPWGLYVG